MSVKSATADEASNGKFSAPATSSGRTGRNAINDLLQGTDGMRRVVVNSIGQEKERLANSRSHFWQTDSG